MKKLVCWFMGIGIIISLNSSAGESVLNCMTGGFAYNGLSVHKLGKDRFIFSTDGLGLGFRSSKIKRRDAISKVEFAISKKDCTSFLGKSEEILCAVEKLTMIAKMTDERNISREVENAYVILKKVSKKYDGIKLLVLSSSNGFREDRIVLSNSFNNCWR